MNELETTLRCGDGTNIFVHAWTTADSEPERVLVCIQGLGGHGGYYEVLAEQLAPAGTLVVAADLRGHGRSEGRRGDIDRFDRYLEDIQATITWVCGRWPALPIVLLGESMGASIAIQYLASGQHGAEIAGLVLVSPVLRATIRPSMREVTRFMRSLLTAPSHPSIAVTGREELGCRDHAFNDRLRADPLFVRHVSVRFLNSLTTWLRQTRRKARSVRHPILILQGAQDYIAHPLGTSRFLRQIATSQHQQHLVTFPDAYHCLLYDPATPAVMQELATWLVAYSVRVDAERVDTWIG